MKENSTLNLLIRYLYEETNPTETKFVEDLLKVNYNLKEVHDGQKETKAILNKTPMMSPSQTSVDLIMQYSASKNKARLEETL